MIPGPEPRSGEPQPLPLVLPFPACTLTALPCSSSQEEMAKLVEGQREKAKQERLHQGFSQDDALPMLFTFEVLAALKTAPDGDPPSARHSRFRKRYLTVKNKTTGKTALLHRQLAAAMLGRPLSPAEIVHHRDGDSTNNDCANLLVLPSQAYHAHVEYHLRCEKKGMPSLFPELFSEVKTQRQGTLFDHLLLKE